MRRSGGCKMSDREQTAVPRLGREIDPAAWSSDKFEISNAADYDVWRARRTESLRVAELEAKNG